MYSQIGCYRGVKYMRMRIGDVLTVDLWSRWWFVLDDDDTPTGDHFRTKRDLFEYINKRLAEAKRERGNEHQGGNNV